MLQYGIKKKEVAAPVEDPGLDGRLGRKKKTPEEMEAEANGELPAGATGEGISFSSLVHKCVAEPCVQPARRNY